MFLRPLVGGSRLAECVEEDGLNEFVELVGGGAAFGMLGGLTTYRSPGRSGLWFFDDSLPGSLERSGLCEASGPGARTDVAVRLILLLTFVAARRGSIEQGWDKLRSCAVGSDFIG